jgi:tetraacyldisaccharide 4'-kinase
MAGMAKSRQQRYVEVMAGLGRGPCAAALRAAAAVAGAAYGGIIRGRNLLYDAGWKKSRRLTRPVVSVGNLSAGGTGKTVLVTQIARWLAEAGRRPAVLIRGYKGNSAAIGSDEAAMLRQSLPGVPVEADPDRLAAGNRLLAGPTPPDLFVLDDGFQHRRLARDLDLVALDATMGLAGPLARMLPRGLLREPISSLRRAHFAVITRADQVPIDALDRLAERIASVAPHLPILRCRHAPTSLLVAGQPRPVSDLQGVPYLAFCGIGNPEAFRRTAAGLPGLCVDFVAFDDHHAYSQADLAALDSRVRQAGAKALLTTAKDRVKLDSLASALPIWTVAVEVEWLPPAAGAPLRDAVLALVKEGHRP